LKLLFLCKEVPCNNGSAGNLRNLRILEWLSSKFEKILLCAHQNNYGDNDLKKFPNIEVMVQNGFQSDLPNILKKYEFEKTWVVHNSLGFYVPIIKRYIRSEIIIDTVDVEFNRLELENKLLGTQHDIYKQRNHEISLYNKCHKIVTVSQREEFFLKDYKN